MLYIFGAFLLYTAVKIARHDESKQVDYNKNIAMRVVRKLVPTTDEYDGQKLFTIENAKRVATPLFTVLVLIEATDVVFAVDSVPAILAVSRETFIVFASNAFAILGLRSLYFLLGGMQGKFRYLNIGLGVILAFVGVKMLLIGEPFEIHLPTYVSLSVIFARARRVDRRLAAGRQARPPAGHPHAAALITRDGGRAGGPRRSATSRSRRRPRRRPPVIAAAASAGTREPTGSSASRAIAATVRWTLSVPITRRRKPTWASRYSAVPPSRAKPGIAPSGSPTWASVDSSPKATSTMPAIIGKWRYAQASRPRSFCALPGGVSARRSPAIVLTTSK